MNNQKVIGHVTPEEKDEIEALFERKNGLAELIKILPINNDSMYEKILKDMSETHKKYQQWWDRMGMKYNWESTKTGNWHINFDTCEVSLECGS